MIIWDRKALPPELAVGKVLELYMVYQRKVGRTKNCLTCGFICIF